LSMDFTLPEVQAFDQRPRFFEDEKTKRLMVEISYIGTKETNIKKVTPEIMAKFPSEWAAYCDGRPMAMRQGTPLTDLPGIDAQMAKAMIDRNVHNLEELAVLSDAQCQGLGHGYLTRRKEARELVTKRRMDAKVRNHDRIAEESSKPAAVVDGQALAAIAELGTKLDALVAVLTAQMAQPPKRGPGRPRKDENGTDDAA
jgi:hypothetical protein